MNIRTARGRWGVLSPTYPWFITDKLHIFPSLINYIFDDLVTKPVDLLLKTDNFDPERVISGIKLLLTNKIYKMYLHKSPEIQWINKYQPFLEESFNENLQAAKSAISKTIIRGAEVTDKKEDLEMMGLEVVDDQVIVNTNNFQDVRTIIYGQDDVRYSYVGNFLVAFLKYNEKVPTYFKDLEIINPGIYTLYHKQFPEKVLKCLTKIDFNNFRKFSEIQEFKHDPHLFSYIFPSILPEGDVKNTIDFHVSRKTIYSGEIICRVQVYDLVTYNRTHIIKEKLLQEFKEIKIPAAIETFTVDDTISAESASEEQVEEIIPIVEPQIEQPPIEQPPIPEPPPPVVQIPVDTIPVQTIEYKYLDQTTPIGRIIEPDDGISPFNTRLLTYQGFKYSGIMAIIYNFAARDLLNMQKIVAVTTIKNKLLQQFEDHELEKWWKEKGLEYLQQILSSQVYTERFYASKYKDIKPLVFLASKRIVSKPIFEHFVGIIVSNEDENVFVLKGKRYKGYNLAGSILN